MRKRIALAIRHKITIVFVLLLVAGLSFSFLVYQRHITIIQDKLRFTQDIDDIEGYILEARRYEKNYFLYGGDENLRQVEYYLKQTEDRLTEVIPKAGRIIKAEKLSNFRGLFTDYRNAIAKYDNTVKTPATADDLDQLNALAEQIRTTGKALTEHIIDTVSEERLHINSLLNYQKNFFFYSLVAYLILVCVAAYYLFLRIVLPLSRIEKAAVEITSGDLRQIPPISGSSEIHSLVAVINRMIAELDKKSEQLIQKEKMAALGTLTSGVAHELNNPLSNISSSTQILLEELGQNELEFQRKLLTAIEEQVEKARDIVKSLLEFARESEFKPLATDIRELIGNTIRLMRSEIPADISVRVEVPETLVAPVDSRRMSQAIMNLILNGVQAMEGSNGVLTVRAREDRDNRSLVIAVEDTGCGISKEDLPRIFDPFFSTKEVDRGTGLGLYVTYGIIKKHGGTVSVSSEPGAGTKFVVTLPTEQLSETQ